HHVLMQLRDVATFAHHAGEIGGGHFATHWTLHDLADLLQVLAEIAALFREKRRVGRYAVKDAELCNRFDVLDAAGVDKDFHGSLLLHNHGIVQFADALDLDRHHVARHQGSDAGGRARGNDVARLERHVEADVLDQLIDGEDQE